MRNYFFEKTMFFSIFFFPLRREKTFFSKIEEKNLKKKLKKIKKKIKENFFHLEMESSNVINYDAIICSHIRNFNYIIEVINNTIKDLLDKKIPLFLIVGLMRQECNILSKNKFTGDDVRLMQSLYRYRHNKKLQKNITSSENEYAENNGKSEEINIKKSEKIEIIKPRIIIKIKNNKIGMQSMPQSHDFQVSERVNRMAIESGKKSVQSALSTADRNHNENLLTN